MEIYISVVSSDKKHQSTKFLEKIIKNFSGGSNVI
jgi:hypothetical protein